MKRIIVFFITLITIFSIGVVSSLAADQVASIKALTNKNEMAAGEKIKLKFAAENISINNGISVMSGFFEYDRNKFEEVQVTDFSTGDGWEPMIYNPKTGEFALNRADGKGTKDNNMLFIVELTSKSNAGIGNTDIGVKDVSIVDGTRDISVDGLKKTVTITETSGSGEGGSEGINPITIVIIIAVGIVVILIITFARGGKGKKRKSKKQSFKKF